MISETGVKWSERSVKLGNVHHQVKQVYLALDFLEGAMTEADIEEKLNIPLKSPRERKSGFYIGEYTNEAKFDTVRISLYENKLSQIDLDNSSLIDFIIEVFKQSMN